MVDQTMSTCLQYDTMWCTVHSQASYCLTIQYHPLGLIDKSVNCNNDKLQYDIMW